MISMNDSAVKRGVEVNKADDAIIQTEGNMVFVDPPSCYTDFDTGIRMLGGSWDEEARQWSAPAARENDVLELVRQHFPSFLRLTIPHRLG